MSSNVISFEPWADAQAVEASVEPAFHKIVVDQIHKSFVTADGTLEVIGGISFKVARGETIAIVGPSGCGKSTLVNILAGFDKPDRGSVTVDGKPRPRASPQGIVISQQGSVFPWLTVYENIVFGLDGLDAQQKRDVSHQLTELVGLKGFERSYPNELSGGMLKRVELARALAVKPEILYMDEPFSALDALMSLRLRTELLELLQKQRQTLLIITHDVEEAIHLADRILVLSTRPAKIKSSFEVPLPHPRKLTSPEAQGLKERVLSELGL